MTSLIGFCNNKFIQIYFVTRTYGSFFLFAYKNVITFVIVLRHHNFKGEASISPVEVICSIIPRGPLRRHQNDYISGYSR
jgi:hypothetical protein